MKTVHRKKKSRETRHTRRNNQSLIRGGKEGKLVQQGITRRFLLVYSSDGILSSVLALVRLLSFHCKRIMILYNHQQRVAWTEIDKLLLNE